MNSMGKVYAGGRSSEESKAETEIKQIEAVDDPVERMLLKSGCLEQHYRVQVGINRS